MRMAIGCVVEGHGDVKAVPELVRRILTEQDASLVPEIPLPVRTPRYRLVKEGELERAVTLAAWKVRQKGIPCAVLVLVDAEDSCPALEGPALVERARKRLPDLPVAVVLAKREFEAWFLAGIESLAHEISFSGIPSDPENIRDAKGHFEKLMDIHYRETIHQSQYARKLEVHLARSRSRSFNKLWCDLDRLRREVARMGHPK